MSLPHYKLALRVFIESYKGLPKSRDLYYYKICHYDIPVIVFLHLRLSPAPLNLYVLRCDLK